MTDIAPNQPIELNFSQEIDTATVDFSTVSIKTAGGRTPEGRFFIRGKGEDRDNRQGHRKQGSVKHADQG